MKKILIISPHFPPSNLAAVHRSRLFAQHLPEFGWDPIILTVAEEFYEEKLDYSLENLLPKNLRVEKVSAFSVTKPRLIGDIGLRGFFQLYRKAKFLIKHENISFLYIPIPSFYTSLLGRWLHSTTKIKYGIDYIDPWVHNFPGSNILLSRHWLSKIVANILEPIAVKKASLITGVAEGYYDEAIKRNPHLLKQAIFGAMPYGGEEKDHQMVSTLGIQPYLFEKKNNKLQFVYAGTFLPKAYEPLEQIFKVIQQEPALFNSIEFHFIGTGKRAIDSNSYNIKALAEQYHLWQTNIFEYPNRIPYLDVIVHMNCADGIFILGSTEPHYTPSKTYQAVLSGKPILAVLHEDSSALRILRDSNAGTILSFKGDKGVNEITTQFASCFREYLQFLKSFEPSQINKRIFDQYSAKNVTYKLVELLDKIEQGFI